MFLFKFRNREGEATNTLVLNVNPKVEAPNTPPNIVKPLTATVCKVGEAIKMETVITGKPKPSLVRRFHSFMQQKLYKIFFTGMVAQW